LISTKKVQRGLKSRTRVLGNFGTGFKVLAE